jgi:hypothetical protein
MMKNVSAVFGRDRNGANGWLAVSYTKYAQIPSKIKSIMLIIMLQLKRLLD